jgi:hypothetical protein
MYYQQPHELRNIKHTVDGHYQIQFIREGKSYSDFAKSLNKAKRIRDKMEVKLGLINQKFSDNPLQNKGSMIPGTSELMPAGLSMTYNVKKRQYYILAHWFKEDKKYKTKGFYAGTDNTYFQGKGDEAYHRAFVFRKAWEAALLNNELTHFDNKKFNIR